MTLLQFRSFIVGIIAMVFLITDKTDGKIFTPCEAVLQLDAAGISRTFTSNWVCLMQHTSGLDSRLQTGPGAYSSYSYGIFQINSRLWCARGQRGGICDYKCENYLHDDIRDDITCAKKIFDTDGFKHWNGWLKNCKGKHLPSYAHCRT